jgi:serine/threonine protein kinase
MEVKVGDFGLAAKIDSTNKKRRTICGTANYIAPEVFEGKKGYSYQADIWSLGVIIYTLLIGEPPFDDKTEKEIYAKIKSNSYSFSKHLKISNEAKDLIKKILNGNPIKRPSLDEISDHSFFANKHLIPKTLPIFMLHVAPSKDYIKKETLKNSSIKETNLEVVKQPKLTIADSEANLIKEWSKNSSKQTIDSPKSEPLIFINTHCSSRSGWIIVQGMEWGICYQMIV